VLYTFHTDFKKQLKKLPPKIVDRFFERLNILLTDPAHPLLNNHDVSKAFPGRRSINVTGDYRAHFKEIDGCYVFVDIGKHVGLYR